MLLRKVLTFGILLLFIGMSIIPSTGMNVVERYPMSTFGGNTLHDSVEITNDNIIWDNGSPTDDWALILSQLDEDWPFNAQVADDFMFEEEDTGVWGVHWWGNFWGVGDPVDPLDFNIYFYADDGTGTAPTGGGMEHPETTALASYFISGVSGVNDSGQRFYSVDLPTPFTALLGEKYWLVAQAVFPALPKWGRVTNNGTIYLAPSVYGWPLVGDPFWTDLGYGDMAWYLTGEAPIPDLECDGSLSWTDVSPEENVTGNFEVLNIGEDFSLLDWEISEWPDWGDWTFNPTSGSDLTPEDGAQTIQVSVIAPDEPETEFTGEVKIVNSEDPNDYCIILVSLITPVSQHSINSQLLQFLQNLMQRFPMLEQILKSSPFLSRMLNLQ